MMLSSENQGVRTTLTLDDDVSAKLRREMRNSGKSFKQTVNEFLRLGLNAPARLKPAKKFVVRTWPLGLRAGYSYDCIATLLDQMDGPDAR